MNILFIFVAIVVIILLIPTFVSWLNYKNGKEWKVIKRIPVKTYNSSIICGMEWYEDDVIVIEKNDSTKELRAWLQGMENKDRKRVSIDYVLSTMPRALSQEIDKMS